MFDQISQYADAGFWILQAVIGLIFIVHGLGKIKRPAEIAGVYGAPVFIGTLHGWIEVLGGVAMIFNFHPKSISIVFGIIMLGAIYYKIFKWKTPFFAINATGWEFDLLILASCIAILTK